MVGPEMDGVERLLRMLIDGGWHQVEELASGVGWSETRTKAALEVLAEMRLVSYQGLDRSAGIDAQLRTLLEE